MAEPTVLRNDRGRIRFLTLNRPHVRNAIDIATMRLLHQEMVHAEEDAAIRVIVIDAKGGIAYRRAVTSPRWRPSRRYPPIR